MEKPEFVSTARSTFEETWKPEASKKVDSIPIAGARVNTDRPHVKVLQPTGGRVSVDFGKEQEYSPSQRTYVVGAIHLA